MIKELSKYIKQYKKASILTPVYVAGEVVMEVAIPFITALLIDKGIEESNMNNVLLYGGIMLVMAFLSLFFGKKAGEYAAEASTGYAANLREGIYEKIQTYSFSNIDKYSTAGLVTRLTTDVTNVQNAYQMIIRMAVRAPLMLVSSIIACVLISPSLSLVFVVAIVFLGIALSIIIYNATKYFNSTFEKYDDLNESVEENVKASRVVKAFVREDYETEKFKSASERLRKMFTKAESIITLNSPVMMLAVYGCILSLSYFGAKQIVSGTLTTGELTSMFSYVMQILMTLMMLSMIFVMVSMSLSSARRICEVLTEVPDIQNPSDPIMKVDNGQIDYNHVSFVYKDGGDEEVLSDIDLHIKSGETIGIIGGTGSGKSSLVSLLSRLYDVSKGEVLIAGKNVKDYDLTVLRDNVAVVLQNNTLFSGTVIENLRWGKPDATYEEAKEACKLACADDFIEKTPGGYDARVEQGGSNFSGGQKQRLCIARALLKSPKILILDDSTSAVDTATDASIRNAFETKIPDTTKIIIAQRISSVEHSDRIVVMDDGKVVGFDTHENLLKNNSIYKEIYDGQNKAGGDFDAPSKD